MAKTEYWHTFISGHCYHIYERSINKEMIFKDRRDVHFLIRVKAMIEIILTTEKKSKYH